MNHKGEIKLFHDGEVVRFHRYVSKMILIVFIKRFRMDAMNMPGICWIDILPDVVRSEKTKPKLVRSEMPIALIRPAAIYDNKKFL